MAGKRKFTADQVIGFVKRAKRNARKRTRAKVQANFRKQWGGYVSRLKSNARRRQSRRIAPKVRLQAPNQTVLQSYFSTKMLPKMKMMAKRFKDQARNFYWQGPSGQQMIAIAGKQGNTSTYVMTASLMRSWASAVGMAPDSSAASIKDTNRLFWKHCEQQRTLTNQTTAVAFVDIYHFVCKRDTNFSPVTLWYAGVSDEANGTMASDFTETLGSTPNLSDALNQYWKLKKIYSIILQPGQVHKHTSRYNIYRVVNNEMIANDIQVNDYLAGITHCTMYVYRGAPGTDSVSSTLVSTAEVKLAAVTTTRVSLTYIADNDFSLKIAGGAGMAASGGDVKFVNTMALTSGAPVALTDTAV